MTVDVDPIDEALLQTAAEGAEEEEPEAEPGLYFGSVDEWFRKYWRYTYRRRVIGKAGTGHGRWKARWWERQEAIARLEALWRGWEAARLDPTGMQAWWVMYADPHMAVLLSDTGPFGDSKDENEFGEPLPYERPPVGLFDPDLQP